MRATRILLLVMAWAVLVASGCNKNTVDKMAFKSALESYYSNQQACLWPSPVKFPAQADTSKEEQTMGFDALTDAGLLTRTPEEKKRFLIGSKQVNDYDLSDQGRAVWKPDPSQPGYGNFCFGHSEVTSIDGYTPTDDSDTRYSVTYHLNDGNPPAWVNSPEMKAAFPTVASETSARHMATATLIKTANGWMVQGVQGEATPGKTVS